MVSSIIEQSILHKAIEKNLVKFDLVDLRDFGLGNYKQIDDTPYGGGGGMQSDGKSRLGPEPQHKRPLVLCIPLFQLSFLPVHALVRMGLAPRSKAAFFRVLSVTLPPHVLLQDVDPLGHPLGVVGLSSAGPVFVDVPQHAFVFRGTVWGRASVLAGTGGSHGGAVHVLNAVAFGGGSAGELDYEYEGAGEVEVWDSGNDSHLTTTTTTTTTTATTTAGTTTTTAAAAADGVGNNEGENGGDGVEAVAPMHA